MRPNHRYLAAIFFAAAVLAFTGCTKSGTPAPEKLQSRSAIPMTEEEDAAKALAEIERDANEMLPVDSEN